MSSRLPGIASDANDCHMAERELLATAAPADAVKLSAFTAAWETATGSGSARGLGAFAERGERLLTGPTTPNSGLAPLTTTSIGRRCRIGGRAVVMRWLLPGETAL